MDLEARAGALFDRVAAEDVDGVLALCAPGCRFKQNNGPEIDIETLLVWLRSRLWDNNIESTYTDVRRVVADDAVVEQHLVTLTRPDGVEAAVDVCVVVRFDESGHIARLDEYADMTAFGPVFG